MATDTMEAAIKARGLQPARDCQTDGLFLEGGEGYTSNYFIRLVQDYGLEVEVRLMADLYISHLILRCMIRPDILFDCLIFKFCELSQKD